MQPIPASKNLEKTFEHELARDRHMLRLFNRATLAWSLLTVATLMTLVIPMRRTSPWLILMSVYAIATRLGVLWARSALLVPRFVVRLNDENAAVRSAAHTVFDRHRPAMTAALGGNRGRSSSELSYEQAAEAARAREIGMRRRVGVYAVAIWGVVTIGFVVILIVTGGGPTN